MREIFDFDIVTGLSVPATFGYYMPGIVKKLYHHKDKCLETMLCIYEQIIGEQ